MIIKYQNIVGIQAENFCNFASGRSGTPETLVELMEWLNSWEQWEILNYTNTSSTDNVRFGDVVSFKNNNFQTFLSGHPNSLNVTTQPAMQDAERWVLIDPDNPTSTDEISTCQSFYIKQVNSDKYAQALGSGHQNNIPLIQQPQVSSCSFIMIAVVV